MGDQCVFNDWCCLGNGHTIAPCRPDDNAWEAFADEHGVPALLDHLGLDGHANTLVEIGAALNAYREFFEAWWDRDKGIVDFDLHAEQVERFRTAFDAVISLRRPISEEDRSVVPGGLRELASPSNDPAKRASSVSRPEGDS